MKAITQTLIDDMLRPYLGEQCPGCGRYFLTLTDLAHSVRGTKDKADGEMTVWHRQCHEQQATTEPAQT